MQPTLTLTLTLTLAAYPNPITRDHALLFTHIPKCGGSSFRNALVRAALTLTLTLILTLTLTLALTLTLTLILTPNP